jgi:hypothetical protein
MIMPDPPKGRLSRRGLLAGVGAGTAGAVALGHPATAAPPPETDAVPADRFGRMFPNLPAFAPANDTVRAAMTDLGRVGGPLDAQDNLARGPIDLIT